VAHKTGAIGPKDLERVVVTASTRREMKRRAAVEPVIGHVKAEHRMDRNYLKGRVGDRINAMLAGRLQLRPAPAMARSTLACHHPSLRRNCPGSKDRLNQRTPAFFTEYYLCLFDFSASVSNVFANGSNNFPNTLPQLSIGWRIDRFKLSAPLTFSNS